MRIGGKRPSGCSTGEINYMLNNKTDLTGKKLTLEEQDELRKTLAARAGKEVL